MVRFKDINDFSSGIFQNINNYQDILAGIDKLENYLIRNNINLDTLLIAKLLCNSKLSSAFDYLHQHSDNDCLVDDIASNTTALIMYHVYCVLQGYISDVSIDIDNATVLSHEDEIILIKKAKKGDKDSLKTIIMYYMPLITDIVEKNKNVKFEQDDLIQEGCLGLVYAVKTFDENKGHLFKRYARLCIENSITSFINKNEKFISFPEGIVVLIKKMENIINDFQDKLQREPSDSEISDIMCVSLQDVKLLKHYSLDTLSLEDLSDNYGDKNSCVEDEFIKRDLSNRIYELFINSGLTELEIKILSLKDGLFGNYQISIEEISSELKLSFDEVKKIALCAMKKIIRSNEIPSFAVYLDNPSRGLKKIHSMKMKDYIRNYKK